MVFAHGYVSPLAPLSFAHLDLPDGTRIPDLIQTLGFAFATTSYRQNGLAVAEGVDDVIELVKAFPSLRRSPPARTYLVGTSEGGLVAAMAAERQPDLFDGALAACAPVGSVQFQLNYVGDFRILFDAFFPGVLPGSPVDIPTTLQANWDRLYAPAIEAAITKAPDRARELMTVARVPFVATDVKAMAKSAVAVLWFNVFGTNDARAKLGGNPFGNRLRLYSGSSNDAALNLRVKRVDADLAALARLQRLATTGDIRIPVVTLATTGDDVVPYAHQLLLASKYRPSGRGRLLPMPVQRHGHCAFQTSEVLTGFALMLTASAAPEPGADAKPRTRIADADLPAGQAEGSTGPASRH